MINNSSIQQAPYSPNEMAPLFSGNNSTAPEYPSSHMALSVHDLARELHIQPSISNFTWQGLCTNPMQHFSSLREKLRTQFGHNLTVSLAALSDAAASTLSYSAGLIANSNKVHRSLTSSGAWAASALFGAIEHTTFIHKPMPLAVLSDLVSLGGAVASMSSNSMSAQGKYGQEILNATSFISNALLLTSGLLSSASVVRGEYDTPEDQTTLPSIAHTGKYLTAVAGLVNVLSALAGILSTATSNGNNIRLNQTSSSLWMAASLLATIGALLRAQMAMSPFVSTEAANNASTLRIQNEQNTKIQELTTQINAQLNVLYAQTEAINEQAETINTQQATIARQADEIKMHKRVSSIQDAAIEKLKTKSFRRRNPQPTVALSDGE